MNIQEDQDAGAVVIDGYRVEGWLDQNRCPYCNSLRVYAMRYDSFFCPACNLWLESNCADPDCEFCRARPLAPLPARASA